MVQESRHPALQKLLEDSPKEWQRRAEQVDLPPPETLLAEDKLWRATLEGPHPVEEQGKQSSWLGLIAHLSTWQRLGLAVTALVAPELADSLRGIWWAAGSSIGLRERHQGRWLLPRRSGLLRTRWGQVRAKQVQKPDGQCSVKPEADDLHSLSEASGCAVDELRRAAAAAEFEASESWSW